MNAWEFVQNLHVGWNLGNTLDATDNEGKRSLNPHDQETAWYNPVTTFEMVKLLKDTGFDIFRVPVTWFMQLGEAPEYIINEAFLNRVEEIVGYGIDNGLKVIINLHHEKWHFPSDENYPAASKQLIAVWKQIAERFAKYDNQLLFEGMNEPRKNGTSVEWNGGDAEGRRVVNLLNADFIKTVRQTGGNNVTRMLLLPTYAASSEDIALQELVIPTDDKNLIVSVHAYTPYPFAIVEDADVNTWKPEYKDIIEAMFERLDKHFLSLGIPVIMGECGVRDKGGNTEARIEWARHYTECARKHKVPCIWWDNGAFEGTGELFGIMNRQKAEWAYPGIVEAFLGK